MWRGCHIDLVALLLILFPWSKYEEIPVERRNTLQLFITTACNLKCEGCFARKVMGEKMEYISLEEYEKVVENFLRKGGKQINLLGGEPLLHPKLREILDINRKKKIKTTIYTNGYFLDKYSEKDFDNIKLRVSIYCKSGNLKGANELPETDLPLDVCFMVSKNTTVDELLASAEHIEKNYNCEVFFISSIRELDNLNKEFFEDTNLTMNLLDYKKLVHDFLRKYSGKMQIHVSKRGVFESTQICAGNKCRFVNYFIGGKIIQCPYDIINLKFQNDYEFDKRFCQQNNTCLMSKVAYKKRVLNSAD